MRDQAFLDAKKIIEDRYPNCDAALLSGSVVRGEGTETSDLDLVVFDFSIDNGFRESYYALNWPVEAFVHNNESYKKFTEQDLNRARPSLPRMMTEGIPIKGAEHLHPLKRKAAEQLSKGPETWDQNQIDLMRYGMTDTLEDLKGAANRAEAVFTVNLLADQIHEFYLRVNQQWIGHGKWVVRSLRRYDEGFAKQFTRAFDQFYRTGVKDEIYTLVEDVLDPYGGPLFEGFSMGKTINTTNNNK